MWFAPASYEAPGPWRIGVRAPPVPDRKGRSPDPNAPPPERFPVPLQFAQQPRQMPIAGIERGISEMQSVAAQAVDHGQRHLTLGAEFDVLGHPGITAALRFGKPLLGNIQLTLDQGSHTIASHGGEDAHWAVVGLPEAPIPLAGHTRRHLALLGKRTLVDHQRAGVAEMRIGIGNQLPVYTASIPRRFAQHVVKPLVVTSGYGLGHLLHVSPPTLEQAVEIQACGVFNRAGEALEAGQVGREVGIEGSERGGDQRGDAI